MLNISWFQLVRYKYLLLNFDIYDHKALGLNLFREIEL